MKKFISAVLLATLIVILSFQNSSADNKNDAFLMNAVILYQEDSVLKERLATNAKIIANYTLLSEARAKKLFEKAEPQKGVSGIIIVAFKPGKKSRIWLELGEGKLPETFKQDLIEDLSSIEAIPVKKGPIMIGLKFDAWGGGKPLEESHPIPQEWKDVIKDKNPVVIPDTPLAVLWPDKQIVADEFFGIWEGELDIIHAPNHEGFGSTVRHRFEFTKDDIVISQEYNDEWLYFNAKSEVSYKTKSHVFIHNISDTGDYIQIYSMNFIRLDEETIYAYVSRVVENYNLQNEEKYRHFPVFAKGIIKKKKVD